MRILDTTVSVITVCESCGEEYNQNFTPDGLSIDEIEHQAATSACPFCGNKVVVERDV